MAQLSIGCSTRLLELRENESVAVYKMGQTYRPQRDAFTGRVSWGFLSLYAYFDRDILAYASVTSDWFHKAPRSGHGLYDSSRIR